MSVKVLDAVFKSDLAGASRRAVLLALADNADKRGLCFPSVMSVARKTGLSRATVFRSLNDLEREGVLRRCRRRRRNGSWTSNGYWIQLDVLAARDRARLRAQVEIDKLEVLFGIEPATDDAAIDTAIAAGAARAAIDTTSGAGGAAADPAVADGLPGGLDRHTTGLLEPVYPQLTPPSHSETGPVSPCDATGVSQPVSLNRQLTVTEEATRASARATSPEPTRSSTARPDPEPIVPGDAPLQELPNRTPQPQPRPDEPTAAAADPLEQPALATSAAVLDTLRPETAAPPTTAAPAPAVSALVTAAAAQAQTLPTPAALVPDPARRETWRCPRHLAHPDPYDRPCGGCGAVRKQMQAHAARQAAEAAQRRAEAAQQARQRRDGCSWCDEYGHVIDPATGQVYDPALRCDHATPAAARVARQAQHLATQAAAEKAARQRSAEAQAAIDATRAHLSHRLLHRTPTPPSRRHRNPKLRR